MVIDKKFKGLVKGLVKEDFIYVFNGDIETTESLEVDLDMGLFVTGSIKAGEYIKAGWYIKAGEYIEAGGSIEAGESIEAGWYIEAGESIEASGSIEAGGYIEAGGSIKASGSIKADGSIKAGGSIEAGGYYGIVAGLSIVCKGTLSFGLKIYAGICSWREISEEEKTVTCGKFNGGVVEYGILKETGLEEEKDDKTEEAMKLLKERGYKIVKD